MNEIGQKINGADLSEEEFTLPPEDMLVCNFIEDMRNLYGQVEPTADAPYSPKFFDSTRFSSFATLLSRGESEELILKSMLSELIKRVGSETGGIITKTEVKVVELKTEAPEPKKPSALRRALGAVGRFLVKVADEPSSSTATTETELKQEKGETVSFEQVKIDPDSAT